MCLSYIVTSKTPRLDFCKEGLLRMSPWTCKSLRFDHLCCFFITGEVSLKSLDVSEKDKRLGHMCRSLDLFFFFEQTQISFIHPKKS